MCGHGLVCADDFLERPPAKEDKNRRDCGGNHLGCHIWANTGLQYGLSGNRVSPAATGRTKR